MPTVDWKRCALYTPGHHVHLIQAKLARDGDPAGYRHGTVMLVQDDGWITVNTDGEDIRLWNHDPERVRSCARESGGQVGLPGWNLLHAPHGDGRRACICVSDHGPTPCAPLSKAGSSPAGLHEQVLSHGGFTVPGIEAVRHLQDDDASACQSPDPRGCH